MTGRRPVSTGAMRMYAGAMNAIGRIAHTTTPSSPITGRVASASRPTTDAIRTCETAPVADATGASLSSIRGQGASYGVMPAPELRSPGLGVHLRFEAAVQNPGFRESL